MKGARARALLEDWGFLVLKDTNVPRGFAVRNSDGTPAGRFDLDDTDHFRFGYVELSNSRGRIDCNSWQEFAIELREIHR